jgi:magnesium transporter
VVTRALALGELDTSDAWRIAMRELISGIALGFGVGFLGVIAILLRQEQLIFAFILLLALVVVTTTGSLIGALMPLFFKRIGMDPAISSGPFVASIVDVFGLFGYCTMAWIILRQFAYH